MKAKWIVTAVFILAAGGETARAQSAGGMTLREALALAEKQNLDLTAFRLRRAIALAGVRTAGQRPNPAISFAAARDLPHEELKLIQSFEIGGQRGRRMDVAKEEGRLTDVEIAAVERAVRHRVRDAFYETVFAKAESDRIAGVVKLAERVQQIAEERFKAGAVPQLEVIQAELELKRMQADLRLAQEREKASQSRLRAVLNLPNDAPVAVNGALADPLPGVTLPDLVARASSSNSELAHIAQEQKVEESRTALLRAERVPDVEVEAGADLNSPPNFRAGLKGAVRVGLPIFSRNQGQIAASEANRNFLGAELAATKRALTARVESAYYEWNARQAQVELYRQTLLPAARRVQGLAEESYRAGKTGILNVLDAQRNVQDVEKSYLENMLALQNAFATLEEAVGAPIE